MLFDTRPSAVYILTSRDADDPISKAPRPLSARNSPKMRPSRYHHLRTFGPAHDFLGTESEAVLDIELPGVARKDVEVFVDGQDLTVTGKRYRRDDEHAAPVKRAKPLNGTTGCETQASGDGAQGGAAGKQKEAGGTTGRSAEVVEKVVEKDARGGCEACAGKKGEEGGVGNGKAVCERSPFRVYSGTFRLHSKVDTARVGVASHEHGVLRLRLPYQEKSLPRKIDIA